MNFSESISPQELFLQINITSRCNLSCTHCYVEDATREMDSDMFVETIGQFLALQARLSMDRAWVQLSGGEPLLHTRFPALLGSSASRLDTKVLTNGTLIDTDTARLLAEHCSSVQVSFDGDTELHDRRRGSGSFDGAIEGLRLLNTAGVPASARITVGGDNCGCVERLFDLLEPMIEAFHVSRVVPMGGCEVQLPDISAYRAIIYRLYALRASNSKVGLRDPFFGVLMSTYDDGPAFCGCSAGVSGLCVNESGDIYPCRRLPISLGNITTTSLTDVYFNHPLLKHLRSRSLKGHCGRCEHRLHCGGGRCVAYALTGDPLAADPGCVFAYTAGDRGQVDES